MEDLEKYYSVSQIEGQLPYSDRRIREFLNKGIIKGTKIGKRNGKWMVSASELERCKQIGQLEKLVEPPEPELVEPDNDFLILEAKRKHFEDISHFIGEIEKRIDSLNSPVSVPKVEKRVDGVFEDRTNGIKWWYGDGVSHATAG